MNNVSFYGTETSGSVADRIQTYKELKRANPMHETTGSVGYMQENTPSLETLDKDTVSFKGNADKKDGGFSVFGTLFTIGALAAVTVAGLGLAHKYDAVSRIPNDKIKDLLKNSGKVTEPCYNWCKTAKTFCIENYNKFVNRFKK